MDMNVVNPACHHQKSELRTACESEMDMNGINPACHHEESEFYTPAVSWKCT